MVIIENLFLNTSKICKKYGFKEKKVKSIFNKRKGERAYNFFLEDYTLNPYMGCSFDCVYCYINGSKYAKETDSFYVKSNSNELIYNILKKKFKNKEKALLNIGSASDPYMDIEKELFLTRDILKTFLKFKYPVHIITKSDLILRDVDILDKINEKAILPDDLEDKLKSKVIISFSFSTIDDEIAKIMEPNAPLPSERLKTIKELSKRDYIVGATFMPILPFLADSDLKIKEAISKFSENNVEYVISGGLSLFGNEDFSSRVKYFETLRKYFNKDLENTEKLFYNEKTKEYREYLSRKYHYELNKKISKYCSEYNIRTTIVK